MKKTQARLELFLLFPILIACAPGTLHAQTPVVVPDLTVKKLVVDWSPANPAAQNVREAQTLAAGLPPIFAAAWTEVRGQICEGLKKALNGYSAPLGGGASVRLSDVTCVLSQQGVFAMELSGAASRARFDLRGNSLAFTASTPMGTTPVSVTGDLRAYFDLVVQPGSGTLALSPGTVTISNEQIKSGSLTAVVQTMWGLVRPFALEQIRQQAVWPNSLNARLAPLNNQLKAASGTVLLARWIRPPTLVVAFAPQAYPGQVVLPRQDPLPADWAAAWFQPVAPLLDASGLMYACLSNVTGQLRVIRANGTCDASRYESRVRWQAQPQ